MYINQEALNITKGFTKEIDTEFGRMKIEKIEAGKLVLKTGRVIATDPILMYDDESYSISVRPGTYTVNLYLGIIKDKPKQSVLAEIVINEEETVKWEMALFKGESSKGFAKDEFMGYEVENGLGCFMDESIMEKLDVMDERDLDNYEKIIREKIKKSETSCAEIFLDQTNSGNIVIFPSGWNTGTFPTYYGFNKDNKLTRFVTDFMVIEK